MTAATRQQSEALEAETTWFHIFRNMIESGDVAKMGPHAITVYLVIKAHTNFATGRAFPAIDTIAEKSGLSVRQIHREMKTLQEFGYITKERRGRNNFYTLREKVHITDENGRPTAVATWDYLPAGVGAAVADLKNVLVSGELGDAKIVHIERLQVQVVNGGVGIQLNETDLSKLPPELKEKIESLMETSRRRSRVNEGKKNKH